MAKSARSTAPPTKPSSSPTDGEDEVGVLLGDEAALGLGALERPSPVGRPLAIAMLRLLLVVRRCPGWCRSRGRGTTVSRSSWYCFSSPSPTTAYTPVTASSPSTTRCFPLTPATASIVTTITARTITVPRSGCSSTSPIGHAHQPDDHGEAPRVDLAAVVVAVAGEDHDQAELRQLRRLQREPARQLEPGLVALDVRADRREHREQQEHGHAVERPSGGRAGAGSRSSSTTTIAAMPERPRTAPGASRSSTGRRGCAGGSSSRSSAGRAR